MSSQEMHFNWRSIAKASSSRITSSLKGYLTQPEQSRSVLSRSATPGGQQKPASGWKEWAGQKFKEKRQSSPGSTPVGVERIALFPGWATRRHEGVASGNTADRFEVDVYVSGYASSHRPPELATRSQRAFIRLAKGFASLPKLVTETAAEHMPHSSGLSASTEDLLKAKNLPPRPDEMTEELEVEALEHQFQHANMSSSGPPSRSSTLDDSEDEFSPSAQPSAGPSELFPQALTRSEIKRLHDNLERRLRPFWSSVLPSRTVRIHIFLSPTNVNGFSSSHSSLSTPSGSTASDSHPIASVDVSTGIDGSFQHRFRLPWELMCQHPGALHIAFGDVNQEHNLQAVAELLPSSSTLSLPSSRTSSRNPSPNSSQSSVSEYFDQKRSSGSGSPRCSVCIPLTQCPIRVISDIDDTVKHSSILSGARAVFQNVFVKDLRDTIIPGMGAWYTDLWRHGVRFHYVSNGPFELLPIVNEFFNISQLPAGSVKLKSYTGRSLFNGLLSAPADRKRAGLLEILDNFPQSQFFLVGDSGEQDLELYAELAQQRPEQILAIFIRDVDNMSDPLDDPTGSVVLQTNDPVNTPRIQTQPQAQPPPRLTRLANLSTSSLHRVFGGGKTPSVKGPVIPSAGDVDTPQASGYFNQKPLADEPEDMTATPVPIQPPFMKSGTRSRLSSFSSIGSYTKSDASSSNRRSALNPDNQGELKLLALAEKRRSELQIRLYRARMIVPDHIVFRVFRDPVECVEAEQILSSM